MVKVVSTAVAREYVTDQGMFGWWLGLQDESPEGLRRERERRKAAKKRERRKLRGLSRPPRQA